MSLVLYNTMKREAEPFQPYCTGKIGFYGCGPTVYNYAHIGNLRAYVTHDILIRTLRRRGYNVTHVMNITDVGHLSGDNDEGDDKMIRSAEERGKSVLEIAEFYTNAFFSDTDRLNIVRPNIVCKATDHIDDMIALIKRIELRGFTYFSGGNLYFDISKFPHYGDLAHLKPDSLKAGARIEVDSSKRNPQDFVLWFTKSKFSNQALTWESPWGRGYPGWHIECSAMSMKYLGEQFDIHAGGIDHIQIHHSNEIAQSEAATGIHPWVRYWVHNEFLVLDKTKMSKSSGGFITLQNIIDLGYSALDYRFFLLGGHYRSQLQFSFDSLESARNSRRSLMSSFRHIAEKAGGLAALDEAAGKMPQGRTAEYLAVFEAALDSDLSTPKAIAALWGLVKDDESRPLDILGAAFSMDDVLGLNLAKELRKNFTESENDMNVDEIEAAIAVRTAAKKAKNFAEADEIRNKLKAEGVILEDSPHGTTWRRG